MRKKWLNELIVPKVVGAFYHNRIFFKNIKNKLLLKQFRTKSCKIGFFKRDASPLIPFLFFFILSPFYFFSLIDIFFKISIREKKKRQRKHVKFFPEKKFYMISAARAASSDLSVLSKKT